MKKTGILILQLLLISVVALSQGINFKHSSLEEAMLEAKKKDKLIFIDFYTEWCGPCKILAKGPFMDEKLGAYYNQNFINLKLDAEKSGKEAARKYGVNSYPTLLFVNAQGNVAYKVTGARDVSGLINSGEKALAARGEYSLEKLQQLFPQKQKDEAFLKIYYQKMLEYGSSPAEGIEAWLKVQTEIKEDDVDMMEFLFENKKYLLVGGKAEAILKENHKEYWDIATRNEEKVLENLKYTLVSNTLKYAYKQKSPEWMRTFIAAWEKLPQKKNFLGGNMKTGNRTEYEMEYHILAREYDVFKTQTKSYLDSIITAKSLEQIRKEDQSDYEYYKKNKYAPSLIGDAILKDMKKGKEAGKQMRTIEKYGTYYLRYVSTAKEYKNLHKWIDYGAQLIAEDHSMQDLKANVLYKQGKVKEAIKYKEMALAKLPQKSRFRGPISRELEKMKKGESL